MNFYIFQMSDGFWHIAPLTENGTVRPHVLLPRKYELAYSTKARAEDALAAALNEIAA